VAAGQLAVLFGLLAGELLARVIGTILVFKKSSISPFVRANLTLLSNSKNSIDLMLLVC